ncbi:MAG: selenoneine synthase SenA [Acidimicrobiales bacterium]
MSEWVSAEELASWVADARQLTMDLVADLSDEQLVGPKLATVNPLIWEIGHLSWFQERFVLRGLYGDLPLLEHGDALYDSGAIPHDTRWHLDLPGRRETLAYLEAVRDRVVDRVLGSSPGDPVRHFATYTVLHEDTHAEAITYTRQTLGYPAPALSSAAPPGTDGDPGAGGEAGPLPGDVEVPGGAFALGAALDQPFAYDNEKWAHRVELAPYAIARAPVTQAQLADFVEDGGYRRRQLWSDRGWAWRVGAGADHPRYWRPSGDGWERRVFDRWVGVEPHRPAVNVSYWEAQAWCRWAGRRLPTEGEWEAAASRPGGDGVGKRRYPWGDDAPTPARANLEWRAMGTVDVAAHPGGDSATGCRQLIGNVWEWTSSTFGPYPHFEPDAYRENSEPWFGTRKVLRGGAWPTRARYVRNTYRNYFTPDRQDIWAGFRTCALG